VGGKPEEYTVPKYWCTPFSTRVVTERVDSIEISGR
jgi:hypothetical protein